MAVAGWPGSWPGSWLAEAVAVARWPVARWPVTGWPVAGGWWLVADGWLAVAVAVAGRPCGHGRAMAGMAGN